MGCNMPWGRSVGRLALLLACSIIIQVAFGNQGRKISKGQNTPAAHAVSYARQTNTIGRNPRKNQQEQIPVVAPTESATGTTAAPTVTSTEPRATKQPFNVLAEDLKDDYFPFEDSSEEESVPVAAAGSYNDDGMNNNTYNGN